MLNRLKRRLIALFCIFSFCLYTTPSFASDLEDNLKDGVVTNIKKGEAAPFDGILLSNIAAAKLYGELNFFEEECKLTLSKELDIAKIRYDAEISALQLKLNVETTRTEKLLQIKDERIQFLEKNWKPTPWYESGEFWLAIGVVSGVLITAAAGHAIQSAAK